MPLSAAFSSSYAEARQKFLAAAQTAGLLVESRRHPQKGREGEDLLMDIARGSMRSTPPRPCGSTGSSSRRAKRWVQAVDGFAG